MPLRRRNRNGQDFEVGGEKTVQSPAVQNKGGKRNPSSPRGGGDGFRESVRIGQRCHLVRTHEGRDLDGIRPRTGQKLHQPQFGLRWQDLSLGLKPIPGGYLVDMQLRQDLNTGKPAKTS